MTEKIKHAYISIKPLDMKVSSIIASCLLPTPFGDLTMEMHHIQGMEIPVLSNMKGIARRAVPVRVHDCCFTSEVFHSQRCDCDAQLQKAMQIISRKGGLLLYLPNEGRGIGLVNKVKAYSVQDELCLDTYAANAHLSLDCDARTYDYVNGIIGCYGIKSIELLTNSKTKYRRLLQTGVTIDATTPIFVRPTRSNFKYMMTKNRVNIQPLMSAFSSVGDALADLRQGRPVVVLDDRDRENEGDLIMAAELATPKWTAFYVKHTSGLICCALTADRARELSLPPMVEHNEDRHATAFTVSVDACNVTTGISATDRSATAMALATCSSVHQFRRPGHMFPLIAKDGGVLQRRGHTEAGVDLCRLAGLRPCAMLAKVTTDDCMGMASGDELEWFAREHDLKMITIEDLVQYQVHANKRLVPPASS